MIYHIYEKTNLNFSQALEYIKQDKKLRRDEWDNNTFIFLTHEGLVFVDEISNVDTYNKIKPVINYPDDVLKFIDHIDMKKNGEIYVGWVPTQKDMLSNDWCVIK